MPDTWILDRARHDRMIEPFEENQVRRGIVSYGLSSYGYDARLSESDFFVFTNTHGVVVDPKSFEDSSLVNVGSNGKRQTGPITSNARGDPFIIPPNSFALGQTHEYMRIPRDVLVICLGKSTYARCGIIVNVTPLEPEWEGSVTLEISNTTPLPACIYPNEGIVQFIFLKGSSPPRMSYADKKGKYMNQNSVQPPKVD